MTCKKCHHARVRRFGTYGKQRIQRYRCSDCRATFSMPPAKPLGNHTLDFDKAVQIVRLLMEGVTIRGRVLPDEELAKMMAVICFAQNPNQGCTPQTVEYEYLKAKKLVHDYRGAGPA